MHGGAILFDFAPPAAAIDRVMQNLRIDAERLWGELMETAAIGGTPKGGICRLTLTDLDRQVRDWFKARCEALGCTVTVDDMGAMFARRKGQRERHPADRDGQPPRHPADGRQVRRRARRARRAGGAAHPGAGRLRDLRADRGDQLDQRGGLALCARDGRARACSPARSPATGPGRARTAMATTFGAALEASDTRGSGLRSASALGLLRAAYRAGADPRSRGQANRRRHRRAGHALVRGHGHRRVTRIPARRRCGCARTRCSALRGWSSGSTDRGAAQARRARRRRADGGPAELAQRCAG